MRKLNAEILAIGDEMIGGGRLDTNSQFLAQQLSEIGVTVIFHTTVGDDEGWQTEAFRRAAERADIVVATGGLGPTADDLTRQVLARVMEVPLVEAPGVLDHIRQLFERYGREMPESNRIQALFPNGSLVIPNSEGTAPGIDASLTVGSRECRFFCLPGVPAEMHEMWTQYVRPAICQILGGPQRIATRIINCFGAGESHIEGLLGDLIARGREPVVGITASQAVIALRIVARGHSAAECDAQIAPTEAFIRDRLGELVFGQGDETLEDVVIQHLERSQRTLAVYDAGLHGEVTSALSRAQARRPGKAHLLAGEMVAPRSLELAQPDQVTPWLAQEAERLHRTSQADWVLAISPIATRAADGRDCFECLLRGPGVLESREYPHAGHSALRQARSVKQVLNFLRLTLAKHPLAAS